MDKKLTYAFTIGVLIISFSIAYYFVVFLPIKEKNLEIKKQALVLCLDSAKNSYRTNWDSACDSQDRTYCRYEDGINTICMENRKKFLQVPCSIKDKEIVTRLDDYLKNEEDKCFKVYK